MNTLYPKIQGLFKRDPKTHKFILWDYSLPEFEYLANNEWWCTEKVDGCLHGSQKILTDIGNIPIKKIYDNKLNVQVASYNFEKKIIEYKKIVAFHREKLKNPYMCISVRSRRRGQRPKYIICTDNHKFYCGDNVWKKAKDLTENDILYHISENVSEEVKQVVLGGLIGDFSVYRSGVNNILYSIVGVHCIEQKEYLNYKIKILNQFFGSMSEYKDNNSFTPDKIKVRFNLMVNKALSEFIEEHCIRNNKKVINKTWLDKLSPLGIAIWYMDDGSCNFSLSQRPRAKFHTQGFTLFEVELLSNKLNSLNIFNKIANYGKGYQIDVSVDGTEQLFAIIAPYVCKSMRYKLSPKYRNYSSYFDQFDEHFFNSSNSIAKTEIISISYDKFPKYMANPNKSKYQYDITVEDNSNYFTGQILVHNSNVRLIWDGEKLDVRGRTDNAQFPVYLMDKIRTYNLEPKLKEVFSDATVECPVVLYCEGYGNKIQKAGHLYIKDGVDIILFDIKFGHWWLERENLEEIVKKLGIKIVPFICQGILRDVVKDFSELHLDLTSRVGEKKLMMEGLVCQPMFTLLQRNGNRVITKIKTVDF